MQSYTQLKIKCIDSFKVQDSLVEDIEIYNGKTLPYKDESFDFTTLIDVIHHEKNQKQLLSEAVRVSNSCIIIKDHCCENLTDQLLLKTMDYVGNTYRGIDCTYKYLSLKDWHQLFSELNLKLEKTIFNKIYNFPLNILFKKHTQVFFILKK